jgi:hypothetical protein
MMGMPAAPQRLFYDFCLVDHVPCDHLLRRIDDFSTWRAFDRNCGPFPSRTMNPLF